MVLSQEPDWRSLPGSFTHINSWMFRNPVPGPSTGLSLLDYSLREPLKKSCHWPFLRFPSSTPPGLRLPEHPPGSFPVPIHCQPLPTSLITSGTSKVELPLRAAPGQMAVD